MNNRAKLNLEQLNQNARALEKINLDAADAVSRLHRVLQYSSSSKLLQNEATDIVLEHYVNLTNQVIQNGRKMSLQEAEQSAAELDKKLSGKEPLSAVIVMAIGGVIGALMGFASGLVIGAVITSWGGGFGAIPGAILGAIKGFTFGSTAGIAGASVGTLAFASLGFFTAKRTHNAYVNNKQKKRDLVTPFLAAMKNAENKLKIARKVVLDNLTKKTTSHPSKSYAEAILDGTITRDDLLKINKAFPATPTYLTLEKHPEKFPEGEYLSKDVIEEFVNILGPYLSDAELHHLTYLLTDIEVNGGDDTAAYRNSSLAKSFMRYAIERHQSESRDNTLPPPLLGLMSNYILPTVKKHWAGDFLKNFYKFVSCNFQLVLTQEMYKAVTQFKPSDFQAPTPPTGLLTEHRQALLQSLGISVACATDANAAPSCRA